jgi:nicotine blue oxidoreductase
MVMRIAAILLAAGEGRRIGGPKALLELAGETFAAACVRRLRRPGVEGVIAVLGHAAETVRAALPEDVRTLTNPRVDDGMLSSLLLGLDAAEAAGATAVLVHPVDHPVISAATVDAVVGALAGGTPIAVPSWQGRGGHPTGFAAVTWPALRAAPLERGARAVLAAHPEWVTRVPADATCRQGVNTPEELEALVAWLSRPSP